MQQHDPMDNGSVEPPPAPVLGGQGPNGADGAASSGPAAMASPNSRTVPNRSSHVTDPSRKHGHDGQATTAMDQGDGDSDSGSSRSGGSPSAPSRDRSVSMNTHSVPPPSKKQRSSDDETETATPRQPRANHSAATTTAVAAEVESAAVAAEDEEEEQSPPFPSSDSPGLTEESFMSWLIEQKNLGVGAGRMLDALGVGVSEGTAVDDDELWEAMISMGIRLIHPSIPARQKLEHVNTLQDVVELLRVSKKVLVLAGAGISVSCGIPDFRSENGIYSRLGEYNLPNPQCMFDIEFFRSNPKPFFAFAKELFPKSAGFTFVPSRSHYFLKLLEEKGKLLRIYSQNIDMLEQAAGISHERSVLCHGSFATATCLACKKVYPSEAIREDVSKQLVPMCKACNSEDGIIKPDIVFFGESLPRRFHDSIKSDENEADLVLVMGSSLKVNPVRSIVGRIRPDTPMVLINREPVGRPHKFDVELLGYSDEIVQELCRLLEWEIPEPDPVLLSQSNHAPQVPVSSHDGSTPLELQFIPPSRHMFNGSKESCSSSDEEDGSASSSEDEEGLDITVDDDAAERKGTRWANGQDTDEDHDHLMGSGNELLGSGSFED